MIVSDIPYSNIPVLHTASTIGEAIHLMQDHSLAHLPVISDERLQGIAALQSLRLQAAEDTLAGEQYNFILSHVLGHHHILTALKIASLHNLSVIPVMDESEKYLGSITYSSLLQALATYLDINKSGGVIVLEMTKHDYSFGELCRLVETNDAYITQLNSFIDAATGLLMVTVKMNKTEVSDIIATFQRYEYNVKYYFGEENYENELKDNYENLMAYLNV